jgi:hypothetical protein
LNVFENVAIGVCVQRQPKDRHRHEVQSEASILQLNSQPDREMAIRRATARKLAAVLFDVLLIDLALATRLETLKVEPLVGAAPTDGHRLKVLEPAGAVVDQPPGVRGPGLVALASGEQMDLNLRSRLIR